MKIYAGQMTREKSLVYDVRVMLHGEARYFIVQVPPAKQRAFIRAVEKDAGFRLEDYGDVLHRGGNAPDDALKAELREKYGMYPEN